MAKTSYGYVERNLENDVNWAEVGKGFSDMLIAEREERKAKKEFLDSAMVQTQEDITKNAPLGYNTQFNDRMIGLASNSNAFVLAANKDLKAGRITPEEYMRKLQRINSSADTVFALGNDFNAIYEDKLIRMDSKPPLSGAVEQTAFEAMADLVNFNNHDFMIDKNGTIVAAPLIQDANGVTTLDGNNARSVQAIFNIAQNKVDRLDVENTIQEKVKKLGQTVLGTSVAATYSKQGMDVLMKGIRRTDPEAYEKWRKETVKEIMANDLDVASVLADYGNAYETTTDKNLYDKNKDKYIYVDITNGREIKVELTEEQKEDALDILYGVIDSQVGSERTEEATSVMRPDVSLRESRSKENAEKFKAQDAVNMLGYLYAPKNDDDMIVAINYFEGLNPDIMDIRRTPEKIEIDTVDKEGNIVTTPIGYGSDFSMFVKGATALTAEKDVSSALSKIDKTKLNVDEKGNYIKSQGTRSQPRKIKTSKSEVDYSQYKKYIDDNVNINNVEQLQNTLSSLGITSIDFPMANGIVIVDDKRGKLVFDYNEKGMNDLKLYLKGNAAAISQYQISTKVNTQGKQNLPGQE
jgi:hypothetical protein